MGDNHHIIASKIKLATTSFLTLVWLLINVTNIHAGDETTPSTVSVQPGNKSLLITAPYADDANLNNELLVEWGLSGINFSLGSQSLPNAPSPYSYTIDGLSNATSYQVRVTWQDIDNTVNPTQALTGLIPCNYMIHSSLSTSSSKWAPSGWGVSGGKYGEFVCLTCHMRQSSNIKRIKPVLTAPNETDQLPIETVVAPGNAVIFSDTRDGSSDFGDDNGGHASSVKICEACHSVTTYHRFDTVTDPDVDGPLTAQTEFGHYNKANCIQCHNHSDGFKASCSGCHDYPPSTNAHSLHTDTLSYSCDDCHFGNVHNPDDISTTPAQFLADYDRIEVDVAFDPAGFNSDANNGTNLGPAFHTANASSTEATCANLNCHNPDNAFTGKGNHLDNNIPVWGSSITDCESCHTTYGFDGGDHGPHLADNVYFGKGVDCVECHSGVNVTDPEISGTNTRHADKTLDIDQSEDYPVLVNANLPYRSGITGQYTDGSPGTRTGGYCKNVYCHGDLDSDIGFNRTMYWGLTDVWSQNCYHCHRYGPNLGSSNNKSHFAHIDELCTTYPNGPCRDNYACGICHKVESYDYMHADGRPDLIGAADGSLTNTTACDSCHGTVTGIAEAKANWFLNVATDRHRITDCLYCHNSTSPANSFQLGTGVDAPAKDNFTITGHGSTGTYNVTNNSGPGYGCTTCHDPDDAHISSKLGDESRLRSVADDGLGYTTVSSELCLDCHKPGKTVSGSLGEDATSEASVHSGAVMDSYNTDDIAAFPAYGNKADYTTSPGYQCADCHDPHGTSKLTMIKGTLNGKIGGIGNPVPISSFESSDVDFTDLDPTTNPSDGVCDTCHSIASSSHVDTLHADNHHQGDNGNACIACHSHEYSFAATGPHVKVIDTSGDTTDRSIDFGSFVATKTADQTITIRNIGTSDLVIGALEANDPLIAPFSMVAGTDNCSGQTIIPTDTCAFDVRFAPSTTGVFSDTFDLPSNDSAGAATISLTGTGTVAGADITISRSEIQFDKQPISSNTSQTITVTNDGVADLTITTIASTDPLTAPFSIATDNCSGLTLTPSASCTIDVQYAPSAFGTFIDSFDIPSDDPDENPVSISVNGSAIWDIYAYVANANTFSSGTISKISTFSDTVETTISVGNRYNPRYVAVKPEGSRIYVSWGGAGANSRIGVYSPTARLTSVTLSANPEGTAISANGAYLYAADNGSQIQKIRTSDNFVTNTVPAYCNPKGYVAASPDSSKIIVTDAGYDRISILRPIDLSLITSVALTFPRGLDFLPDSSEAYIAVSGGIAVVRLSDNVVVKNIALPGSPIDVRISPDGSYAYVSDANGAGAVHVIRISDDTLINTISLSLADHTVSGISMTPDGEKLYITAPKNVATESDLVKVVSTTTNTVIATMTVGVSPLSIGKFIQARDPNTSSPDITITDTEGHADDHGVDFGNVTVNQASTDQTVTITNNGSEDLVIGNIATLDPASAPFSIVGASDNCSGQTLPQTSSCTFQVRFAPTAEGVFYGRFDIPNNDPYESPTSVTLTGVGVVPEITVTDAVLPADDLQIDFGDKVITTTQSISLTVKNDGIGRLIFNNFVTTAPFSVNLATSSCDSYVGAPGLAPNASCTLMVDFSPNETGPYGETLSISSNDQDENPVLVTLTGSGSPSAPDIALISPYSTTAPGITTFDFGYFAVTNSQVQKYLYVRNEGTENLTLGTISLPADPGPFSISLDYNLSGSTITPSSMVSSTWMRLYFDPTSVGPFNTSLTIPNNDPDESPAILELTGHGFENMYAFIPSFYGVMPYSVYYSSDGTVNNTALTKLNTNYTSGIEATPSITYQTSYIYDRLTFFQTSNRANLAQVDIPGDPWGVSVAPGEELIYVAQNALNQVSIVSRSQQKVLATFAVGAGPWGLDTTPDGNYVYVANRTDGSISVVRASDNQLIETINVDTDPRVVIVSSDGSHAYVSNYGSGTVSVIRTSDNTVIDTINVGASPYGLSVTPDNAFVYVGNYGDSSVSVIRTSDNSVVTTLSGVTEPVGMDVTTDGRFVYAISDQPGGTLRTSVTIIRTSDHTIDRTFTLTSGDSSYAFGKFITANNSGPDFDGVPDLNDNCPTISNALQTDSDGDGAGDACDPCAEDVDDDIDGDGICLGNGFNAPKTGDNDNCPTIENTDQSDVDSDGIGDACDSCPNDPDNDAADGDGVCGDVDNCPVTANTDQLDSDCDGAGDACSAPVYHRPTSIEITPQQFLADNTISWLDTFDGENGYLVERKAETCNSAVLSFSPIARLYQNDDFANGLDSTAWDSRAQVLESTVWGIPAATSGASGTAEVIWENGAIKLHTTANDVDDPNLNNAFIQLNNPENIIGDGDFDIQFDYSLPNGSTTTTQYHVYARLAVIFPDTAGGANSLYLERRNGDLDFIGLTIDGAAEYGSTTNIDPSGKLRLVRTNRQMAAYAWSGTDWHLLLEHPQPQTEALAPWRLRIFQFAHRDEAGGQDITALIDNFRFNSVRSEPVAAFHAEIEEPLWQGDVDEVRDIAAGENHGTSFNGPVIDSDINRGTVARFDGVDDHVEISGTGTLGKVTDSSYTFTAWAKPMSVPPHSDPNPPANDWIYTIIGRPGWHTDLHYNQNKRFRFEMWNSDDLATPIPPADPKQFGVNSAQYNAAVWHHLAGVVDDNAKTVSLYVDGQLEGTTPYDGTLRDYGISSYYIGSSSYGASAYNWFFDGFIDDVRIFDQALSTTEVKRIFNGDSRYEDSGLSTDTEYCYRIYPFISDNCPNWENHALEIDYKSPSNTLPSQPVNQIPANVATDVYELTPTLSASGFDDLDPGDTHYASQWLVSSEGGALFDANIVYDSGAVAADTSHAITTTLLTNIAYCWKVRYQDSKGGWSSYSDVFTFVISNNAPDQPTNAIPANSATGVAITPVLTASIFSNNDIVNGDTHQASQWLLSTGSGAAFDANIFYDSGSVVGSNTHTVTSNGAFGTLYFWKVRYQDSRNDWSAYSAETSFTIITNVVPDQPTNATPLESANNVVPEPSLSASVFIDNDAGDAHQASQWVISTANGASFDTSIVYDTGSVAATTNHDVTSPLSRGTTHYWKVRYQDSKGEWSAYSTETSFVTTNIISAWHFDEGAGTTSADLIGVNDVSLVAAPNNPTWTSDSISGNALAFDGTGDEIYWGYSGGVLANTFTIEVSAKAVTTHEIDSESQTGAGGVSGQHYLFWPNYPSDSSRSPYPGVNTQDAGMGISLGTNGISTYEHGSSYMPAHAVYSGSLGTGWNHIIVVYNNKTPHIYLNGVLVRSGLQSTRQNVYAPIRIGYGQYGHFQGTVDEVIVYGSALNATEVKDRCEVIKGVGQCN